jgi:hypothetical protein
MIKMLCVLMISMCYVNASPPRKCRRHTPHRVPPPTRRVLPRLTPQAPRQLTPRLRVFPRQYLLLLRAQLMPLPLSRLKPPPRIPPTLPLPIPHPPPPHTQRQPPLVSVSWGIATAAATEARASPTPRDMLCASAMTPATTGPLSSAEFIATEGSWKTATVAFLA